MVGDIYGTSMKVIISVAMLKSDIYRELPQLVQLN